MTRTEVGDIVAAKSGSHVAFERAVEPYRRELHRHCYRMTGSVDDADDLVQETLFRAWRSLGTYAGRSSFRAWLYRIATNRTIDILGGKSRREIAVEWTEQDDELEPMWLQPYHPEVDPAAAAERREDLSIAFVVAIQRLPPAQRAVLLFRDVLGFTAIETAQALDTTVAAANSSLQRARLKTAMRADLRPSSAAELTLRDQLIEAWHRVDVEAMAALMATDVSLTMPPIPKRIETQPLVLAFMAERAPAGGLGRMRVLPTMANRQPALGLYTRNEQDELTRLAIMSIVATTVEQVALIDRLVVYLLPADHFDRFGLPLHPTDEFPHRDRS